MNHRHEPGPPQALAVPGEVLRQGCTRGKHLLRADPDGVVVVGEGGDGVGKQGRGRPVLLNGAELVEPGDVHVAEEPGSYTVLASLLLGSHLRLNHDGNQEVQQQDRNQHPKHQIEPQVGRLLLLRRLELIIPQKQAERTVHRAGHRGEIRVQVADVVVGKPAEPDEHRSEHNAQVPEIVSSVPESSGDDGGFRVDVAEEGQVDAHVDYREAHGVPAKFFHFRDAEELVSSAHKSVEDSVHPGDVLLRTLPPTSRHVRVQQLRETTENRLGFGGEMDHVPALQGKEQGHGNQSAGADLGLHPSVPPPDPGRQVQHRPR
mmetsp:Transcript_8187/g.20236  ORF Transcript_8187/g.20236 Transcript_8187/m.20236 type:complete len:318 (+) Transcript_8187:384-1337(+)